MKPTGTNSGHPSVLVVEDEPLISAFIADCLEDHGFKVHAVATAREALKYLRSEAPVDALFTDINLPGGMDGAMLAQTARAMRPELPVLYASGRVTAAQVSSVSRSLFVQKPYDADFVCAMLSRLVSTP